jgi:signal transduction histidine kinase/CheY-like chemotaxis protein
MFDRLMTAKWRIILAGTLISAAPLIGLALFVYISVTDELEKLSSDQQQAVANSAANILDEKLRGAITFGSVFVSRDTLEAGIISGNVKVMRRNLKDIVEMSDSMERVFITSPKGILLADYPAEPTVLGKDFSQRDYYRGVSRNWKPYISEFFQRDAPPHQNVFSIAVPIRSDADDVIGILVMQPRPDFVKNALDRIKHAHGISYLVDNKGTIIYHPDLTLDKSVNISGSSVVKKGMQGLNGTEKGIDPLTGERVISAYQPVDISGWVVVTETHLGEVLAPVRNVTRGIYLFTAIMLLLSAWFAYRRSEMIFHIKKTSNELLQEDTVNKAYGYVLTLINNEWTSVEELTHAALTRLGSDASIISGVSYLVQEQGLVPVSSMGIPLPAAAGGMVQEALERNEVVVVRNIPGDSILCVTTAIGSLVPREIIAVPLTVRQEVVAVMELASLHGFGETDLRIIKLIAPQLGIGIGTIKSNLKLKRLSDELQKSNEEFQTMNEELQSMNEELQAQQEELAEGNRKLSEVSRTKSDFLANMSHELRTPLNSVIGFSEVLQDQIFGALNEKQQEYVDNILTSGRHQLSLINDILDLSKVESGMMELELSSFSLRETLDASLSMLREKALKSELELNMEITPEADVNIVADQRKLKQIMFNLVSNAVKFTPPGGTVDISARIDGDFLEITVADTGSGIREEDIPKLFHPFTQLESVYTREYEGTGLGLALNRQLVELHGGRIWVESRFGAGSRFSFTIPVSQTAANAPHPVAPDIVRSGGNTVLVIEDDPLTLGALERILHSKGYRALRASDGETGLEIAQRDQPDLIVLDLMMPGMNGFDVVGRLQEGNVAVNVPILVLTSMDLSSADRMRLAGKVWRIEGKGSLSTHEFLNLVESAVGPQAVMPDPLRLTKL